VSFAQVYNNLPVYNSRIQLVINSSGKLLRVRSSVYPNLNISTTPGISEANAINSAKTVFGFQAGIDSVGAVELGISPVRSAQTVIPKLVYLVPLSDGDFPDQWVYFVDANDGSIVTNRRDTDNDVIQGTVTGYIYPDYPTDTRELNVWQFGQVDVDAYTTYTDENGFYSVVVPPAFHEIGAGPLQGEHLVVFDNAGPELSYSSVPTGDGNNDWTWNTSGSYSAENDDEVNAWYHATKIYKYVDNPSHLDWDLMDEYTDRMKIYVRDGNICNAFYDEGDIFLKNGDGVNCLNPALDSDVIYHEYGHAFTRHIYPKPQYWWPDEWYAMNEGFSDVWAAILNNDPQINEGWVINVPGAVRNLNNTLKYPNDYITGNDHHNGQIIGGAVWNLRADINDNDAEKLFFEALFYNGLDFNEYLEDVLLAADILFGDGNGVIDLQTPYLDNILWAFGDHGIYPNDPNIPRAAPRNLQVSASANNHPFLTWENVNKPNSVCCFNIYKKIGGGNWNLYEEFVGWEGNTTYEDIAETVVGLPQANSYRVYYKVKALDDYVNEFSNFSNVADIEVEGDPLEKQAGGNQDSFIPREFALEQNYPNPFNPTTTISFDLPEESPVKLAVYDIRGAEIVTLLQKKLPAGRHHVTFNAGTFSSGIYLYRITAGKFSDTKRMILLK